MVRQDAANIDILNIRPKDGKAALVMIRNNALCGGITFETYLDKHMIGTTQGTSGVVFINTEIPPGTQHVISTSLNADAFRINFEPGRIYYIKQYPIWAFPTCALVTGPLSQEEAKVIWSEGVNLFEYDGANPGEDLSDQYFNEVVEIYEKESNKDQKTVDENYKIKLSYKGYDPKTSEKP